VYAISKSLGNQPFPIIISKISKAITHFHFSNLLSPLSNLKCITQVLFDATNDLGEKKITEKIKVMPNYCGSPLWGI